MIKDWFTVKWIITLILVVLMYYLFIHKEAIKEAFNNSIFVNKEDFRVPLYGDGYYTTPLNNLYYYHWPYSQVYRMPYRYGGMTRYNRYPYRAQRYFPGWYYNEVGYPNDRRFHLI